METVPRAAERGGAKRNEVYGDWVVRGPPDDQPTVASELSHLQLD